MYVFSCPGLQGRVDYPCLAVWPCEGLGLTSYYLYDIGNGYIKYHLGTQRSDNVFIQQVARSQEFYVLL